MKKRPLFRGFQLLAVAGAGGGTLLLGCFNSGNQIGPDTRSRTPVHTVIDKPAQISPVVEARASAPDAKPVAGTESTLPPALEKLSPGMADILKLVESNVSEEVLIVYIEKADFTFSASVDEILYLSDLGVSDKVITAILNRGKTSQATAQTSAPENPAVSANETVTTVAPPAEPLPPSPVPPIPSETEAPPPSTVTVTTTPAQPVTINYFYQSLAPYGSWVEVDGYGYCWQPTVVVSNPHWRPYCDRGRWIYSNCGWYWQSDYSWGWAAFHYGRWHQATRHGWVWVPDTTWGPSWVSWRRTDDHCGWAPLPPAARYRSGFGFSYRDSKVGIHFDFGLTPDCYTFVPTQRFCDPHPSRYRASDIRCTSLFGRSTVHNNYVVNNNVVINNGIEPGVVSAASGSEVKKVTLQTAPVPPPRKPSPQNKKSDTMVVYAPAIQPSTIAPAPPPRRTEFKKTSAPVISSVAAPAPKNDKLPSVAPSVSSPAPRWAPAPRKLETSKPIVAQVPEVAAKVEDPSLAPISQNEKPSFDSAPVVAPPPNQNLPAPRSIARISRERSEPRIVAPAPVNVIPVQPQISRPESPRIISQPAPARREPTQNIPVARVNSPPANPVVPSPRQNLPRVSTPAPVVREAPVIVSRPAQSFQPSAPAPQPRIAAIPTPAVRPQSTPVQRSQPVITPSAPVIPPRPVQIAPAPSRAISPAPQSPIAKIPSPAATPSPAKVPPPRTERREKHAEKK